MGWRTDLSPRSRIVTFTLTLLHPKLLSLNLSCNKLYHLDGLSDIVHMVPTIKILNLSNNEVRRGSQIKVGMRVEGLVVVIRVMTGGR